MPNNAEKNKWTFIVFYKHIFHKKIIKKIVKTHHGGWKAFSVLQFTEFCEFGVGNDVIGVNLLKDNNQDCKIREMKVSRKSNFLSIENVKDRSLKREMGEFNSVSG